MLGAGQHWLQLGCSAPLLSTSLPRHIPPCRRPPVALAPLSGWIVGQHGVPTSIAVYFGLVTAALVPTVLLPLRGKLAGWLWADRQQQLGQSSEACWMMHGACW